MGYKPQGTIYNLHFEGEEYDGLQIKMKGMTIGRLSRLVQQGWDTKNPQNNKEIFDFLASRVLEWNIDHPEIDNPHPDSDPNNPRCYQCGKHEGDPLPISGEAMLCLDVMFIMKISNVWVEAVASVAAPKEMNMNVGDKVEERLRMLQAEALPIPNL